MELDFSVLNDDQLVDLIRAACAEAARRNIEAVAKGVMLDEADKARIAREAIERERTRSAREEAERIACEALAKEKAKQEAQAQKAKEARLAQTWEWKEAMGARISAILRPSKSQTLTVWNKTDKRIYLGHGYGDNMAIYHHTGTHTYKPRSIAIVKRPGNFSEAEWKAGQEKAVETALLPLFAEICEKWNAIEFEIPAYVEPETKEEVAA